MKTCRFILSLLLLVQLAHAQETAIELGKSVKIKSAVLNETRELFIYSPPGAGNNHQKYPVIYLFDGGSLFYTMVGAVRFMNYSSHMPQMPEAYIVGIANANRDRDMPIPQSIDTTKGAANFYKFLADEVVPYMNSNYQTSGLNILTGHSQGGLFVTYATLQNPKLFPFVLALDAPMTVVQSVEQQYLQKIKSVCGLKYASVETLYGWGGSIKDTSGCLTFKSIAIKGESHETMPYKGIYEGLKFLFDDYVPKTEDLSLPALTKYYADLRAKYGFQYEIPETVLLESARQNIGQSKKDVALALINESEKLYGASASTALLLKKVNLITKGPDDRVTYNLKHAPPGEIEVKPFSGKWAGVLKVPDGEDMQISWEIKKINGAYKMEANVMDQFISVSDFLYVNEKKQLIWGRKHGGGGIYLSVGTISADGNTISGTEDMVGIDPPPGITLVQNTFVFKKTK